MNVAEKIALTDEQIAALDAGERLVIRATWEEFEDFLTDTPFRVEYHNGQLIIMGLATFIHEVLVAQLIYLLKGFYADEPYYVVGSNAGIRKDGKRKHYNGDALVVKGQPQFQGRSRSIITNPFLIVEVLSESTLNYDLGDKRRQYEQMDTVQEIVFVDPFEQQVQVCRRTDRPNAWLETTYTQPDELIQIDTHTVRLGAVFSNLPPNLLA